MDPSLSAFIFIFLHIDASVNNALSFCRVLYFTLKEECCTIWATCFPWSYSEYHVAMLTLPVCVPAGYSPLISWHDETLSPIFVRTQDRSLVRPSILQWDIDQTATHKQEQVMWECLSSWHWPIALHSKSYRGFTSTWFLKIHSLFTFWLITKLEIHSHFDLSIFQVKTWR